MYPLGAKMSINQLQAEYFPQLSGQYIYRKLELHWQKIRKATHARIRKTRRMCLTWYSRQYFLASAHSGMKVSIKRNEDIFIATALVAFGLIYACATIAAELAFTFFITAFSFSEVSGINMLLVALVAAGSLGAILIWVAAFILNSMSIALMHGANRKQIRSVRATLRQGLAQAGRTATSWLVFLSAILFPVAIVGAAGLLHLLLFISTQAQMLSVMPYYIIAAIVGVIYILLQYSLMPFVAFFEPALWYRCAFKRSRELISKKGRMFILAGYGILGAFIAAEYALSRFLQDLIGLHRNLSFSIMLIITAIYAYGITTMLYRKRRMTINREK
jgi:hypothetical protein